MAAGVFELDEDAGAVSRGQAGVGEAGAVLGAARRHLDGGVQLTAARWTGPRSEVFDAAASGTTALLTRAAAGCVEVESVLGDLAAAVRRTEDVLAHLAAQHAALPMHLNTPGVYPPGALGAAQRQSETITTHAAEVRHRLEQTEQRAASAIDAVTARLLPGSTQVAPSAAARQVTDALGEPSGHGLARALGVLAPAVLANADGSLHDLPGPHAAPPDVHAWWTGLDATRRSGLLRCLPSYLGNLDGIPALDRDVANRIVLPRELARLRDEIAALGPRPQTPTYPAGRTSQVAESAYLTWVHRREELLARLRGSLTIQQRLEGGGDPPYLLLGYRPRVGRGRSILSWGDPDTARHTGVLVPGTFAGLGSLAVDLDRGDRLMRLAGGEHPRATAMLTWHGYDAPQSIPGEASDLGYAERAAPVLRRFAAGLRATHRPGRTGRVHLFSHSYGTTLAGYAASHGHRLPVDDVVMVGSPGAGVGHGWTGTGTVEDLRLTGPSPGHVFATRSHHDVIKLATGTHLGTDPVDPRFGAHVFGSDPDVGHTDYWRDPPGPSMKAMALVLAGQGDDVAPPTPEQEIYDSETPDVLWRTQWLSG